MVLIVSPHWGVKFYLYGISYKMVLIVSLYWDIRFIYHNSSRTTTRSGYVDSREYWDLIPRCSWPEGTATKCPQVLDFVVQKHSASNVGGDTNQK